ncbi:acyltransferase family protein [Brucella tritici]|uniref:acyltransferase family protein n=1 Tax=Brucella tritici TaxID=94626 RepID=UPI00142ECDD4|nr:acyltransferase [Brucella tritici]
MYGETRLRPMRFNKNIHYLRGIAAALVLLGHSGHYLKEYLNIDWAAAVFPHTLGLWGVGVFFAISGYLMATLVHKDDWASFLFKRLARIYPLFFLVTAISVLCFPEAYPSPYNIYSAVLAPMPAATYPLRVEWTLVHEIYFYVLLTIFLLTGKAKIIPYFAAVWIVITLYVSISGMALPRIGRADFFEIFIMPANSAFAVGLLIPLFAQRFTTPLVSIFLFVVLLIVQHHVPASFNRVTSGIGSGFLVLAAVQSSFAAPRFIDITLHKLGDWSYAMYLVHVSIFVAILPILDPSHDFFTWAIASFLAVFFSIIFGEIDIFIVKMSKIVIPLISYRLACLICSLFLILYFSVSILNVFNVSFINGDRM